MELSLQNNETIHLIGGLAVTWLVITNRWIILKATRVPLVPPPPPVGLAVVEALTKSNTYQVPPGGLGTKNLYFFFNGEKEHLERVQFTILKCFLFTWNICTADETRLFEVGENLFLFQFFISRERETTTKNFSNFPFVDGFPLRSDPIFHLFHSFFFTHFL